MRTVGDGDTEHVRRAAGKKADKKNMMTGCINAAPGPRYTWNILEDMKIS